MSIRKRISKIISCILTMAMVLSCMANMTPAFAAASIEKNDVPTVYSGSGNENATGSAFKFDFGNSTVEGGYTQITASTTYSAEIGYGFATTGDSLVNVTTSQTSSDSLLIDAVGAKASSNYDFMVDLPSGKYTMEIGIGSERENNQVLFTLTDASDNQLYKDSAAHANTNGTYVFDTVEIPEFEFTGGTLTVNIAATSGSRKAMVNYIVIEPVFEPVTWTFGESYNEVKAFNTATLAETAIGTTGFKAATSVANTPWHNVVVVNNDNMDSGIFPYADSYPTENGYYLFLGSGGDTTTVTLTLPKAVPAGMAMDIEFVKLCTTNNLNKGKADRGGKNKAQSIAVDTTTIDVQNGYEFTTWNTKTVVTENEVSTITVTLGEWAAVGIKSITVRETTPEDFAKVNVEFDLNGHGTTTPDSQELSVGSAALEPTAPRADGYVFRGWYTDAACTSAWNFSTGVTEDTILYARWIEDPVVTVENALYTQFFSGTADASSLIAKKAAGSAMETKSILADDTHGYYLYAKATGGGDRDAFVAFSGLDVSEEYTIEFDAMLTPGSGATTQWLLTSSDATYSSDITSGYILKLKNQAAYGTVYTVNDDANTTITIPGDKWCHFKLDVDKVAGTVTINITGDGVAVTDVVTNYKGAGDLAGFYTYAPRYYHAFSMDNVVVYETPVEYATVTFDVQGKGMATAPVAQTVVVGEAAEEPTAPTEDGWVFGGWYTDDTFTELYIFDTPVTKDTIVYAKWTEATGQKYTVTFDVQGKGEAPEAQEIEEGKTATKPETDPTYDGWKFGGWYKDAECATEYSFAAPVTGNTTVYAKWTQIFTVTFDVQGKGTAPEAQKVLDGEKATTPDAPTYDGYAFEGWYTDAGCTAEYSFDTAVTKDTTLYAKWTQTFTVTFNANGHGTAPEAQKVVSGKTATQPSISESGWEFGGWYTEAGCTNKYDFATPVTANVELFAKWTKVEVPASALYYQYFTDVTTITSDLASSTNAGNQLNILTDDAHGKYFTFDLSSLRPSGARGALLNFINCDVSNENIYIIEFDALIKPATESGGSASQFAVKGADLVYGLDSNNKNNINNGAASGYIFKLANAGAKSTEYTVNDTDNKVTIPNDEWCHYKLYVDKTFGKVSITITNGEDVIEEKLIVSVNGAGNATGFYLLAGRYDGSFNVDNIVVRTTTENDEVEIKSGTNYYLAMDATGNTTAVDTSSLIFNSNVTGYRVTTSKNGKLVKQEVVANAPTSVDTTGADKLEIAVVLYYDCGAAGELGEGGKDLGLPAGTYDFIVYSKGSKRCDVYVNDQILVNNLLQNGNTPNYYALKDIVVTGNTFTIATTDYSTGDSAANQDIEVQVVQSSTIVDRVQKVFVLGDSLVAVYYNGANANNNIRTGWGQVLADYLTDDVDVVDLANSGAWSEGLYATAFTQVAKSGKSGDILILESGYNDKTYGTEAKMKAAVTGMVNDAEALGMEVILVSPNASAHDYKESVAWTSYMADVATAEGVTYIDLSKLSYNFLKETYSGDLDVITVNYNLPQDDNDTLHSTYNAANKWASLVAGSLYEQGYASIVNADYVYAFSDTLGNVISCSATGKLAEGYVKVTFDMNGQNIANTYKSVKTGELVTKPASPAVTGFVFNGWYKDAACTTAWDFAVDTVSADTTIYAGWIENAAGTLYTQNFSDVTSAKDVATSTNGADQLQIYADGPNGKYFAFDWSNKSDNSRGAVMDFAGLDVSEHKKYVIEFDAMITPGNNQNSTFAVKSTDASYTMNDGISSGYIISLDNGAGGSTSYTMNGTQKVDIPSGEWCHYVLYVDKELGLVSVSITSTSKTVADKVLVAYNGAGDVNGFYMRAGRYYPYIAIDEILVREVGEYDEFGEVGAETLSSAVFTSELNKVIAQPAEGAPVHLPITIKGNGSLGGDLSDKVTVKWSVVGLENEDGYISLTKAEGTGAGTDGAAPDGTTAYLNVRNGVSNYFGYVQAVVSYGDNSYTIKTPFAVLGGSAVSSNQLAPVGGYPVSMDDYADSLIGYVGTSNAINSKDVVLNNWSIYGSNGARTMSLVEKSGKKAIEFSTGGGSGSTLAVYQWADQASQYVIDVTVMFTADMSFGLWNNTPNNGGAVAEWSVSYSGGALTLGTESVSNINKNEWYRIVVSADPSTNLASMNVYDMTGASLGSVTDAEMTTTTAKYFCFNGTWPMYLNSFKAYKPGLSTIVVGSDVDTVKVPEAGEEAKTVDFTAILSSEDGMQMTGEVAWSLAEEYANVELVATGAQTATLTINEGAAGTITVVATKDGKQGEKTIQLTTSSNVVAFKQSASSITIPFAGQESVVTTYTATTYDGNGAEIDGGAITYTLLAKDGVTAANVKGVTFENGVLTVAAGASPAVVYVKAANAEGLSTKVKVNIHGLSFAFGSDEPEEGYTHVTADSLYTAKLGYGFANTTGLTANAGNVTGTSAFRFKANVPNGNYTVKVTTSAASMTSEVVESVSATTGITKTGSSFSVAVCDGVLDLTFPAGSTVTALEISQATPKSALEKPMIYAIGDSTTKNNASGALSWGNCVADGKVIVPSTFGGFANHGMAGRDSVSYYNEGRVEAVLLAICPGDYVTVNMGINSKEAGEADSYYTLMSEYYVEGIIQRGGIPVIVTATPDGPVGNSVSGNYNSTTGKFTNNRGDGARNNVLRQIASEKGLTLIELGQWGEDWMNTLTAADVTAYNKTYGTSYTTVLEMVQSWYVDHNHYKEYLGIKIGEYLLGELNNLAAEKEGVIFDFENEISANWGMTGDLSGSVTIVEASGNKYLQIEKNEARTTTTKRVIEELPKMLTADVTFDWYVGAQTSTSRMGHTGIKFMSGDTELVTLYFSDLRAAGDTSTVWYSNSGYDAKVASNVTVEYDSWYEVSMKYDFTNDTLAVYIGGAKVVDGLAIEPVVQNVNAVAFVTVDPNGGTKVTPKMGIDNLSFSYVEKTTDDDVVTIYSLGAIENVPVTKFEYQSGYTHPTTVEATLSNGDVITVEINAATWACANFDANKKAAYTWTADIIAPAEYANTKGLKATYIMEYSTISAGEHDYYNDFTFASEMIPSIAWGKGMNSTSGTGGFNLSHVMGTDGNGYLHASVSGGGDRGSRLDLESGIIKGATVSFDWMPIECGSTSEGELIFVSNSSWHSYFGLKYDKNYDIIAYTKNELPSSTIQEEYEGAITSADPIKTGLGGQNKWFTVTVEFDYLAHTADLTITEKANPANTFTQNDIPIDTKANGVRSLVMHMIKLSGTGSATMGLDNIIVDYNVFGENDIVKVTNPANVSVARSQWDDYNFATSVKVTFGDGSTAMLPITKWTATPEFDENVSGVYVWSADLIVGNYTNYFNLNTSFEMTYTLYPYPTYVYNPTTLELNFGEEFTGEFPSTVIAHMSNGSITRVELGEWTAIREFNSAEEGIYVYGANVVNKEGVYEVIDEKLTPNENPDDPSAQRKDYVYDVYYRISYFESEDNYNAYARTMEYLDRGVYAVETNDGVFVSWRLLATEYGDNISFNVYRNGNLANEKPITGKTNFVDPYGAGGDVYTVAKIENGVFYESEPVNALYRNYISIPTQKPEGLTDKDGNECTYTMNDAGTADVDGDGQYEIIIKWIPDDAFDSGSAVSPSGPTVFDVYEMDGTPLWRLNLGLEMPSGAHFNPFMLYDMDEDGKAELFLKTSDGSVTYKPNAAGKFDMTDESTIVSYIGDKNVVPGTNVNSNGHMSSNTNEYVTVFDGMTGEEIDTVEFANLTGNYADWGKEDGGNRSARYNIAIAYLPADQDDPNCTTTIPAVLYNRGYYDKTTVAAYALRDGKITLEWNFVVPSGTSDSGKGNHNMSTGDVDKDGFDELVIGAMAIDHDGSILWVKDGQNGQDYAGHADSIHLAAMNPNKNDLYVFTPQEHTDATFNHSLSNAGTGTRWLASWFTLKDVGRGVAANITPLPGYEFWAASTGSGLYAFDGSIISTSNGVPMNWVIYWDGDLLSELADGASTEGNMKITKYNWETDSCDLVAQFYGTKMCNWTKNTPSLTADILGDWREEVIMRNEDDTELRIYMTTIETDYMIYTLMHDPVYRNSVANQNTSYNQPTHVGIYLGEDQRDVVLNMQLDTAAIKYAVEVEEEGEDIPDRPVISDDYFADDNNISFVEDSWNGNEGWQKVNGEWYYFNESGKAQTGWVEDKDGQWYYMNKDGKMATEWVQSPESKLWYYMDATGGQMISNDWLCDPKSGRWYYLDSNGAMCTGWILLDGTWYLLDKSGAMCTGWNLVNGNWYLLGQNGAMLTGWQEVAGKFYYMVETGECLINTTTPDGRKVDENGARID